MTDSRNPPGSSSGPGVDRTGQPVQDPTPNVLDLVQAAIARQDDLRELTAAHLREIAELRAAYEDKLRSAESDRIDAIRAVDAAAVQRAAEVQAAQQQALAAQVATTADAFRASLAAALAPITTSVDDLRSKDIADLRRAQYEAQGQKTQVVEGSSVDRDVNALEAVRIQAAQARMQMYALVFAAIIVALGIYAAFHH